MNPDELSHLDAIMALIRTEVIRARGLHAPFNSLHEGYGVLKEEVDEFWDEVRCDQAGRAVAEAVQVGAMAARIVMDFTDSPD